MVQRLFLCCTGKLKRFLYDCNDLFKYYMKKWSWNSSIFFCSATNLNFLVVDLLVIWDAKGPIFEGTPNFLKVNQVLKSLEKKKKTTIIFPKKIIPLNISICKKCNKFTLSSVHLQALKVCFCKIFLQFPFCYCLIYLKKCLHAVITEC